MLKYREGLLHCYNFGSKDDLHQKRKEREKDYGHENDARSEKINNLKR